MQTNYLEAFTNGVIELATKFFAPKKEYTDPIGRINSFEDALEDQGKKASDVLRYILPATPEQEWENNCDRWKTIVKSLNRPDFVPDYRNEKQGKWLPVIIWDKTLNNGAGAFRFWRSHLGYTATRTTTGARLVLESERLSDYAGKAFLSLLIKIINPLQ